MSFDRFERVLLRASDAPGVRLVIGPREQSLCARFGVLPGRDEVCVSVLEERAKVGVDALELRAAGLVHRGFEDVHDEGGQTLAREWVLVHEVVLCCLPLGHVMRAVLPAGAVLEVSPRQDGLPGFRAIEHGAEAEAWINSKERGDDL